MLVPNSIYYHCRIMTKKPKANPNRDKKGRYKSTKLTPVEVRVVKQLNTYKLNKHSKLINPPKTIKAQNDLADEFVEWSYRNDSFAIEDFPLSKKMSPTYFYALAFQNEYFLHALDIAKHNIGSRLMSCWRNKTLDREYALKMFPLYNKKYKEYLFEKTSALSNLVSEKNLKNFNIEKKEFILPKDKDLTHGNN